MTREPGIPAVLIDLPGGCPTNAYGNGRPDYSVRARFAGSWE